MDAVVTHRARERALAARLGRFDQAKLAAWALGFALPCYLALRGGGYEAVLRDQVGLALWWIVALGALVGIMPAHRPTRGQLLLVGALVAFAAWTAVGALWSESAGATVDELSALSAYAAILTLGVIGVRAGARDWLAGGVAVATAAIATLALLSRLHPAWFPADQTAQFLPGTASRLNYPLNYWNGLAAFVALGVPLALHFTGAARLAALRALAAAALVVMAATVYLTFSRGGVAEVAVAVAVTLALAPRRLWRLATLLVVAVGAGVLILAIHQRPAIEHGLTGTAAANRGGDELLVVAIVVCVGVALLQSALALVERHARVPVALSRATAPRAWKWLALVALAAVVFLVAGGPHELASAWREFKTLNISAASTLQGRLTSVSGEGRYQFWISALHAFSSNPFGGIGANTFQFWWAAHGSIYSYVINAHSLYFETLAETGIVGAALLALALVGGVAIVALRWWRADGVQRGLLAAILGSCAAFLVAAGVDWVWQIPAVPAVFLLLVGVGAAGPARGRRVSDDGERTGGPARAGWIALAVVAAAAILVPLESGLALRESQAQSTREQLPSALRAADTSVSWEPYAAAGPLQQALVLEQARRFSAAGRDVRRATALQATDWSTWLVAARIEAERGDATAALTDYRRARTLDPHDPIFQTKR